MIFRHDCNVDHLLDNSICHVWRRLHRMLAISGLHLSSSASANAISVMILSDVDTVVLEMGSRIAFCLLLN